MLVFSQSTWPGLVLQVRLDVVQQLLNLDGIRLEGDLVAVAEAIFDGGLAAGRLELDRLETAPVADDLIEALRTEALVAVAIVLHGGLPGRGRLGILPAILVDLGDLVAGCLRPAGFCRGRRCAVDLQIIELVGHLEALNAAGEPGDGLVVAEGVQGVGAAVRPSCRPRVERSRDRPRSARRTAIAGTGRNAGRLHWRGGVGVHGGLDIQRQRSPSLRAAS